jgi:hypothetical protein
MNRSICLVLASSALLSACSDNPVTIDPGPKKPLSLSFCPSLMPTWVAVQSQGEGWTEVTPNAQGVVTAQVTEKVSIAVVQEFGSNAFTQVLNATVTELGDDAGIPCESTSGTATIYGSVAGLAGTQFAKVSAGGENAGVTADAPNYQLTDLASGTHDVVATRYPSIFSTPADRIIIRRGILPQPGFPISTLDFGNTFESFALESANAAFTNLGNANLAVDVDLHTATGTSHNLMAMGPTTATSVSYVSVPAQLRMSTDYHELYAVANSSQATRTISHFYKTPSAKTLAFGPVPNDATLSTVASSPYIRTRARIASQSEYPSAVMIQLDNANTAEDFRSVSVVTTSGFNGGRPPTWDLTVPDMTGGGYDAAWALQAAPSDYVVYAFNGSAGALLGAVPADGATITMGLRFGPPLFDTRARATQPRGLVRVR